MKGALHVSLRNLMEKITPSASKGFPLVEYFLLLGEQHKLPVGQHKLLGEQHKLLGWQHKIHHHHSTFSSSLALAFCRACSSSAKSERVLLCFRFLRSAGAQANKFGVLATLEIKGDRRRQSHVNEPSFRKCCSHITPIFYSYYTYVHLQLLSN